LTAIDESLVEIAENVNVYYFEDSAKAHNTKPFSDSENELAGTERTRDIVELLKQLNCLRHLCTLSTVTSWRSSPTEGFFNFASPKEKSKTAHPVQATRKKGTAGTAGTPPQTTSQVHGASRRVPIVSFQISAPLRPTGLVFSGNKTFRY
jgi:predicted secreted protein